MVITVFGANGKVGQLVVIEALKKGYKINAFVHGNNPFDENTNLTVFQGNIYNPEDVKKSLIGCEAVISTLGSWGTPKKDILTEGIKNIIPAMKDLRLNRIISLTGSEARASGDKLGIIHSLMHLFLSIFARKILLDGENHIKLLEQSNLDWTVLRSPVMNEKGNAEYILSTKRCLPWQTINRKSVANALIKQIETNENSRKALYISRV